MLDITLTLVIFWNQKWAFKFIFLLHYVPATLGKVTSHIICILPFIAWQYSQIIIFHSASIFLIMVLFSFYTGLLWCNIPWHYSYHAWKRWPCQ